MNSIRKILQRRLNILCEKYNMSQVKVMLNSSLLKINTQHKKHIVGQCDPINKRIVLNEKVLLENDGEIVILMGLYHEFRHYWQFHNYKSLYCWWLSQSRRDIYKKYYDTKICNIEEDARVFACSFGLQNREDLLEDYPVEVLNHLTNQPLQMKLLLENLS